MIFCVKHNSHQIILRPAEEPVSPLPKQSCRTISNIVAITHTYMSNAYKVLKGKQQLAIAKISCVLYYWQWLRKVILTFYQ